MKMKHLFLIVLFLATSTIVSAKKMITPIELVALQADLIVVGEIINVNSNSYQFKVTNQIKGESTSQLTVQKFTEWECDVRFDKVKIGQKLFLFLKKKNKKFELINGNTGEIPIIDNQLILNHQVEKEFKIDLLEFQTAIKKFSECFMIENCISCELVETISQRCSDEIIIKNALDYSFFNWLYNRVKENYTLAKS